MALDQQTNVEVNIPQAKTAFIQLGGSLTGARASSGAATVTLSVVRVGTLVLLGKNLTLSYMFSLHL